MLGAIFSLFFLMIFMLAVMVTDFFMEVGRIKRGIDESFSKEPSIFPDYEYFL
jgi:hypothetical protein